MATLTIEVGGFTGQISVSNAVAAEKLELYIAREGGPSAGTEQEKIDWVVRALARHIDGKSEELELAEALRVERERVLAEQKTRKWSPAESAPQPSKPGA